MVKHSLSHDKIHQFIEILTKNVKGRITLKNHQISFSQLGIGENEAHYSAPTYKDRLKRIAEKFRNHLFIKESVHIEVIENMEGGKYERLGQLHTIFIGGNFEDQNLPQKTATLAHEMTHYYLMKKRNIVLDSVMENELFTDFAAAYLGFGLILLEGYELYPGFFSELGYLDRPSLLNIIIETAIHRRQQPLWLLDQMEDKDEKRLMKKRLKKLIYAYEKSKKKS